MNPPTGHQRLFHTFSAEAAPSQAAALRIDAVLQERPDLAGQPCVIPDSGQCGITCLFPHEVVKMPRLSEQEKDFAREPLVLSHLHLHGLPVPAVTSLGRQSAFYGQERLQGKHLDVSQLTPQVARDIATFMAAMQKVVSDDDAARMGYADQTPAPDDMERLLSSTAVKRLLLECDEDVVADLRDYVRERAAVRPVFLHADITPSNVLYDESKGRVAAVIDFGLCHYGDPAVAMHAIYHHFPRDFAEDVARNYAELTGGETITCQRAVLARVASEFAAVCGIATPDGLTHANTRWMQELLIEYDNAAAPQSINHNLLRAF